VATIQPDRFGQTLSQEDLDEYPCIIWDHAERFTREQGDLVCSLMDRADLKTIFVFTTSEYSKLSQGIRARVLRVPCSKPSQSDLTGLLGSICAAHKLNFELDALNLLATRTHGVPSQAIKALHAVSLLGDITAGTVAKLQVSIEEQASQLLTRIALNQSPMELVEQIKDSYPTEELIDAMFTVYARAVYDNDKSSHVIVEQLSNYKRVGEVFIKWKGLTNPPPAALFILTRELLDSNKVVDVPAQADAAPVIQRDRQITRKELDDLIEEARRTGDPEIR
jgi:DNA polymerase III delta prime subunit